MAVAGRNKPLLTGGSSSSSPESDTTRVRKGWAFVTGRGGEGEKKRKKKIIGR